MLPDAYHWWQPALLVAAILVSLWAWDVPEKARTKWRRITRNRPGVEPETVIARRQRLLTARRPVLQYEGIHGQMWGQIYPATPYNLQLAKFHNIQTAIRNTAAGVTARIEYVHRSGTRHVVPNAAWLVKDFQWMSTVFIKSDQVATLIVMAEKMYDDPGFVASPREISGDAHYMQDLEDGHWELNIIVKFENGEPLKLHGGFTILPNRGLKYDDPALMEVLYETENQTTNIQANG